jgi:hypothetical protein
LPVTPTHARDSSTRAVRIPAMAQAKDSGVPSFQEALKNDREHFDDCTPCRIVGESSQLPFLHVQLLTCLAGSGAFLGLGAYTYMSGHSQLKAQEAAIKRSKSIFGMASRRAAITGTATALVGAGVYRWFN